MAGGTGSRLHPLTLVQSKQLLPVYDKPMIYYPLSTLMLTGIQDISIVVKPGDLHRFQELLGDGALLGINLNYVVQSEPNGIAEAFILCKEFIESTSVGLILGDNLFHGPGLGTSLQRFSNPTGANIFAYQVKNPRDYGVVTFDVSGKALSLEEKPMKPQSNFAVPGLYFYDETVVQRSLELVPSARGELEITSLNNSYLKDGLLAVTPLPRGTAWLDTGTPEDLLAASNYVRVIEERQGVKISVPEEIAYRMGWIGKTELELSNLKFLGSSYSKYLTSLVDENFS